MRRSRSVCLRLNKQKPSHSSVSKTSKSVSVSSACTSSFKPEYVFLAKSRTVQNKAA
jgi:hypothetical protein